MFVMKEGLFHELLILIIGPIDPLSININLIYIQFL